MLSFVVYYVIDNYVCIEHLGCKYKKLSVICYDKVFEDRSYNELIGIDIPEVLMISGHGFMKDISSNVILLCLTQLVEYYLSKGFVTIEHNSKNLSSVTNEAKQRIHAIDMHDSDYVMSCYT